MMDVWEEGRSRGRAGEQEEGEGSSCSSRKLEFLKFEQIWSLHRLLDRSESEDFRKTRADERDDRRNRRMRRRGLFHLVRLRPPSSLFPSLHSSLLLRLLSRWTSNNDSPLSNTPTRRRLCSFNLKPQPSLVSPPRTKLNVPPPPTSPPPSPVSPPRTRPSEPRTRNKIELSGISRGNCFLLGIGSWKELWKRGRKVAGSGLSFVPSSPLTTSHHFTDLSLF